MTTKELNTRIDNKIFAKDSFLRGEIRHYFKHRHIGLAGHIDFDMIHSMVRSTIKELRVWREMGYRNENYLKN